MLKAIFDKIKRILGKEAKPEQLSFSQTIARMFDVKTAEARGLLTLVLIGTISFQWFTRSSYDFIMASDAKHGWIFLTSTILLITSLLFLHDKFKKSSSQQTYTAGSPKKSKGLVFLLSNYNGKYKGYPLEDLVNDLNDKHLKIETLRKKLFQTNLGTLMYTLEYHNECLTHCWMVCSEQSKEYYEIARMLIKRVIPNCSTFLVKVNNNDIDVNSIRNIYYESTKNHLSKENLIFDFTGGTSSMTGSMILAAIGDELLLEYLKQDRSLEDLLEDSGSYKEHLLNNYGFVSEERNETLVLIKPNRKIVKK